MRVAIKPQSSLLKALQYRKLAGMTRNDDYFPQSIYKISIANISIRCFSIMLIVPQTCMCIGKKTLTKYIILYICRSAFDNNRSMAVLS